MGLYTRTFLGSEADVIFISAVDDSGSGAVMTAITEAPPSPVMAAVASRGSATLHPILPGERGV